MERCRRNGSESSPGSAGGGHAALSIADGELGRDKRKEASALRAVCAGRSLFLVWCRFPCHYSGTFTPHSSLLWHFHTSLVTTLAPSQLTRHYSPSDTSL